MVDYYKILGVKQAATATEVKSAYRRLARERHPDVNGGSEQAAREFALIALAYRTLTDPNERAFYDEMRRKRRRDAASGSVLNSDNPHAQRMRKMAVQARFDRVVDRFIENERKESFVQQQAVFTTVTLFLSTFFVAMFKPGLWQGFSYVGRAVIFVLFLVGLWHLAVRLRACFKHYTYQPKRLQEPLIAVTDDDEAQPKKPFTRLTAAVFLVLGFATSFAAGLLIGAHANDSIIFSAIRYLNQPLGIELIYYPPIAVLIVDTMHTFASKID